MRRNTYPSCVPFEEPELTAKVRFLSEGVHLGEPGVAVERVETHFAWVFLTPQHVYKLGKPVRDRSLNTLSIEARRARCNEELRLNQALAPGVYLETLPLMIEPDGRMKLSRAGEAIEPESGGIVDWLLHMRRLPAARMLDRLIAAGTWRSAELEAVAAHLHGFYAQTPARPMSGPMYCQRLVAGIQRNRGELLAARSVGVDASKVAEIASLQQHWVDANRATLMQRAGQRMIRDCHGDLKPEHICLGPPVSVIDRLEFDADLRLLDPLEDLCFLWLECIRLGAPLVGEAVVHRYLSMSGQETASALSDFYLSHRALTRAKLAAWRLAEPDGDHARWRARLQDYVRLAWDAASRAGR